jgi:bacillopeptidase F
VSLSLAAIIVLVASPARAQREVAYDDGTPERTMVWNERGNGLAVRFSVERGSILLGARFCTGFAPFWNPLGICVLEANGLGGAPGDTLMSYYVEPLDAWSGWQDVAFRNPLPIASGEFYIVYLQTGSANGDATPFALDTSNPGPGRSWIFESHVWSPLAPTSGNVMIRAILSSVVPVVPVTWSAIKAQYRVPR